NQHLNSFPTRRSSDLIRPNPTTDPRRDEKASHSSRARRREDPRAASEAKCSAFSAQPVSTRRWLLPPFSRPASFFWRAHRERCRSEEHTSELQSPDHL